MRFSKRLRTLKALRRCLSPLAALMPAGHSNRNIPRLVRRLIRATQESAPGWLRMRYQALGQLGGARRNLVAGSQPSEVRARMCKRARAAVALWLNYTCKQTQ